MTCFDTTYLWQPIETAPDLERVMVCGWSPPYRTTRGYWRYGEDVVADRKGVEYSHAEFWAPLIIPPFPEEPTP